MPITSEISLNTSPFLKGVKEVQAATERMMKDAPKKGKQAAGGLEFEQGKKAERQISGLAQDLLNARSGADVLGAALGRAGDILKVGLGVGVVSQLVGTFKQWGDQTNAQIDALREKIKGLKEAAGTARDFGGFGENVGAMKAGADALAEIGKAQKDLGSVKGFVGQLFTGGLFTGDSAARFRELGKSKGEVVKMQEENAQAALDDLDLTARIAEAKAAGADDEAERLTRNRDLKRQLLAIDRSNLSPEQKTEASDLATRASEAAGGAAGKAAERAFAGREAKQAADAEERITALKRERAQMNETEEQRAQRLVAEVNELYRISGETVVLNEKINELAKIYGDQQKRNNQQAEQAAALKEKEAIDAQIAVRQSDLDLLTGIQNKDTAPGSPGQADANRRLGLGGYAAGGSEITAAMREANTQRAEIIRILQEQIKALRESKSGPGKSGSATFG